MRDPLQAIDTDALGQRPEVDVAGLGHCRDDVDDPVGLGAVEPPAADLVEPVAGHLLLGRHEVVLERGDGGHELVRGRRVEVVADRLVDVRLVRVGQHGLLLRTRQVPRHHVGVERRPRDEHQDAAGRHLDDDEACGGVVAQRPFGEALQLDVEGEGDVVAGVRGHVALLAGEELLGVLVGEAVLLRVHDVVLEAALAAQVVLPLLLDAAL